MRKLSMPNNEKGSIMVIAVIILMILTLIGISITTTTSLELNIASNDRLHKTAFHTADGGTELGSEIIEQNLGCVTGFTETAPTYTDIGTLRVLDLDMWLNTSATEPSDGDRDLFFPANYGTAPHTNLNIGGNTVLSSGSAIQMVAGYEGKGKGAGGGGGYIMYNIFSQHRGIVGSESVIKILWRHVIGQEGGCNY